jgi:beta-lactamase superfamily II metal-dependent hydrolase
MRLGLLAILLPALAGALFGAKNLEIISIDVEGGQATLFAAPSGESLLIDTGWGGHDHRDAERIAAAAKMLGVKRIDYLVITHYHSDHVGGVSQLAEKLPIRNFVDHGENAEHTKEVDQLYAAYVDHRAKGKHIQVKPGDTIPIKGLDVRVLTAAGETIPAPLAGGGQPNPACSSFERRPVDTSENARSVGLLITYGQFRLVDLGDLTWNKEYDLVCPQNKVGPVDVYVVSHHGLEQSNSPQLLHALHPRVAIMNNGARKGGSPAAWQIVHDSPGLLDLWQVHFAIEGGREHNSSDTVIANLDEACEGKWLRVNAQSDGDFTVINSRNKFEKTYKK